MNDVPSLPLAITTGDPAGVGPRISIAAAAADADGRFVLYGDAAQLDALAAATDVSVVHVDTVRDAAPKGLSIVDTGRCDPSAIAAHAATVDGGRAQLRALDRAAADLLAGHARALVTAPTSKEAVVMAGTSFRGQTEHLAKAAGLPVDAVTMLFLGERLRTGLVTTHHSIRDVPALITEARVGRAARHLGEALVALGAESEARAEGAPEVVVTGLNPHAGEGGLFGDEEGDAIRLGIASARRVAPFADGRLVLTGPMGAETAFRWAADGRIAGVVAMMHDQATIAAKLLDWQSSVNVTWGLPFIRTSVDHGVAYDAARSGEVHADGMKAAVQMARALT